MSVEKLVQNHYYLDFSAWVETDSEANLTLGTFLATDAIATFEQDLLLLIFYTLAGFEYMFHQLKEIEHHQF